MRDLVRGDTSYTLLRLDVRFLGILDTMGEHLYGAEWEVDIR